jgi:hypothetical protein
MPAPSRIPRLVIGVEWFDKWVDTVVASIERALNVTSSDGISVRRGPSGTHIALNVLPTLILAKAHLGIPAMSGTTPGHALVTLYDFQFGGPSVVTQGITDTAWNYSSAAVDIGKKIKVARIGKFLWVIWEDCP